MADNGTQDYQAFNVHTGRHLVTGFAKADSYNAVYDEDTMVKIMGNRGLGAWVKRYSLSAVITIELFATSRDNDVFSAIWQADFRSRRGFGVPIVVIDQNGTTVQTCTLARIMKLPDNPRGDAVNSRTWLWGTTHLDSFIGGNLAPIVGTAEEAIALAAALPPLPVAA